MIIMDKNYREILFLHLQGIVLIPTLNQIFKSKIINILMNNKEISIKSLTKETDINEGYINVAFRTLRSADLLKTETNDDEIKRKYFPTENLKKLYKNKDMIESFCQLLHYHEKFSSLNNELGSMGENVIFIDNQNWEDKIIRSRYSNFINDIAYPFNFNGLEMSLSSDSTLSYRGVEIDYLKLLFKPENGCNKGDIDHDGIINVIDIVNLVNFIFETATPVYYQECTSDMNSDEILNVLDVVLIVDLIFGIDN